MKSSLVLSLISNFPGKRVLIVGDVMVDEYIYGDVHRISPEAPVPVVEIQRRTFTPGGAANTAMNIVDLEGEALLCGVVGNDNQADALRKIMNSRTNLKTKLFVDDQRPTTTKTRVIAHNQHIVRMDHEKKSSIGEALEEQLLAWVDTAIEKADVCVLSDYDKGVLTSRLTSKVIEMARADKKQVIVDPKSSDFTKYRFATIVTPNQSEAERAINGTVFGEKNLLEIGQRLQHITEGAAVLITRGSEGMTLFSGENIIQIPAMVRKVYDVTGAGDTVVSVVALALASGANLNEAASIANIAAGIVVGKVGTATVTANEIMRWVKLCA